MSARSLYSRQKSCDACVRGKRRCGQENPSCVRCTRMGLSCTYKTASAFSQRFLSDHLEAKQSSNPIKDPQAAASTLFEPNTTLFLANFSECVTPTPGVEIADVLRHISANTLSQDRLDFCVRQFESYPQMLLSCNRTPFIHLELYNDFLPLPQALQEAYAICALYLSKTDATTTTVFRIIETKCSLIIDESRTNWAISEHLAALQAFCLFQIIRLFDGDIRQRAIAEQQESIIVDWTANLLQRTQDSQSPVSPSWHDWIFGESLRRTIIMSMMIQGVYSVIKRGFCCISDAVASQSFTAQTALWEAESAFDWQKAFKEKNHFAVNKMVFDQVLEKGNRADVDDMGLLMMVTYLGPDKVREWAARDGFQLEMFKDLNL